MSEFDPTKNVNLDEAREESAAEVGDRLLEQVGLKDRVFFDESASNYWMQNAAGEWVGRNEKMFSSYLKRSGVNAARDDKEKMSDLDLLLLHISLNCAVAFAGPIAGYRKGLVENNGQPILVTKSPKLPAPEPGEFDVLLSLIRQQFGPQDDDPIDQTPYLFSWWKFALDCLHNGAGDMRGLALVFAGPAGCGKSLLAEIIKLSFGGRHCEPYDYMTGRDKFNGEFLGSELWLVDDESALTDRKSRAEYGASLKKIVAKQEFKIRGMHRESIVLRMFRRSLTTVNDEPDKITVIPQLDDDIAGKMCILLARGKPMPMPSKTKQEKAAFWAQLMKDLPGLIHWLLNEFDEDPDHDGRFGSAPYCHPKIKRTLYEMSAERVLWEQIDKVLKLDADGIGGGCEGWYWEGTATELRNLLTADDAPLTKREKDSVTAPSYFGRYLAKIHAEYPERIRIRKSNGKKWWQVIAEGRDFLSLDEFSTYAKTGKTYE